MTTDMVGLISPQITSCLLNQQSSLPSPEKVKKQTQARPLMANEKMTSFSIVTSCSGFTQVNTRSWSSKLTEY